MSDHPLYLQRVMLADGRTGTIIEVHGDGEAFMFEPTGATGLDDLVTITADAMRSAKVGTKVVAIGRLKGEPSFAANLAGIKRRMVDDDYLEGPPTFIGDDA